MVRSLQDVSPVQCFGCGAHNTHGFRIKSFWDGDELLCTWQPEPYHIGHPGYVYGGIIASVVDCHSIWTAIAHYCRDNNQSLDDGRLPAAYVTAALKVNYLKPVPIEGKMELRARPLEKSERKTVVGCRVFHSGIECANAEVVAVRVQGRP